MARATKLLCSWPAVAIFGIGLCAVILLIVLTNYNPPRYEIGKYSSCRLEYIGKTVEVVDPDADGLRCFGIA